MNRKVKRAFQAWVFILGIFIFPGTSGVQAQLQWHTDFERACRVADSTGKPLLLVFSGSDWCKPCIIFERSVLSDEGFLKFAADSVVLVKADFPRKNKNKLTGAQEQHNNALAEKFNPSGRFPLAILFEQGQKVRTELTTAVTPQDFIRMIRRRGDRGGE